VKRITDFESGFSMLEVLIALFVLALGLLGLLSLQMTSLKNNHSAQMRTTATVLAYDILDRIRLNKTENYAFLLSSTATQGTAQKDKDIYAWINEISSTLPSGAGGITINGDIVTVQVQWDDARAGGGRQQSFQVSSQP
jgi:type IV pilus assembly protein PilV